MGILLKGLAYFLDPIFQPAYLFKMQLWKTTTSPTSKRIGLTRPLTGKASLGKKETFVLLRYNRNLIKGMANTIDSIFQPSYLFGLSPRENQVDPTKP